MRKPETMPRPSRRIIRSCGGSVKAIRMPPISSTIATPIASWLWCRQDNSGTWPVASIVKTSSSRCSGAFFEGSVAVCTTHPLAKNCGDLFLVITLNKIRSKGVFHRAAKRDVRMTVGGACIDQYPDGLKSGEHAYVLLKLAVEESLDGLPAQHRLVVQLRMEGHEVAEIAKMMGRGKRSVERILQQCRERLSRLLVGP